MGLLKRLDLLTSTDGCIFRTWPAHQKQPFYLLLGLDGAATNSWVWFHFPSLLFIFYPSTLFFRFMPLSFLCYQISNILLTKPYYWPHTANIHIQVPMHILKPLSICSSFCSCSKRGPSQGSKKKKEECLRVLPNPGTCGPWEKLEEEGTIAQDKKNKGTF